MVDDYTHDDDFVAIYTKVSKVQKVPLCTIKDGFLMYGSHLCITKSFHERFWKKAMIPLTQENLESNLQFKGCKSTIISQL